MKKFSKKVMAIIGTATLAVGLMALPALAGTNQQQGAGWIGQMQSFMQQTFSSGQHQAIMNSSAMQNLHNSASMQNAMQTGDVQAMQDLMNSDPNIKTQIGQENLDKMNQFMSQSRGNMMTNGSGFTASGSARMTKGSGTTNTSGTMMTNGSSVRSGSSMMNSSKSSKSGNGMMNF